MQANLFGGDEPSDEAIKHSIDNAQLLEYPQIVDRAEATQMFERLIADIPWQQEHLRIAGKLRAIPRLQCWMGDSASEYGYSGVRLAPCPWHKTVQAIHDRVADLSGSTFNCVLINYYRDGQDSVAWHADDETELGDTPVIASVSLGAERIFELKQKHQTPAKKYKLLLRHGSLLIMGGTMQQHWLHQLPKENGLAEARINLTFRNIISS
ncbi:MAG: alpha-ketoglutarate-dependent dioxygenase AlkB [Proteobacteria bacterium]|jgi:alkylated DNA repair dioxygenase AlkB|nr:alpha-ketoglutarate-dependent dioxygenase AlkB [Pseudomonadota bacterium]MDA1291993.1 alpha-ketoglutarate-dependent dioxygenase AlkB [Pseudomonadota bacterium]